MPQRILRFADQEISVAIHFNSETQMYSLTFADQHFAGVSLQHLQHGFMCIHQHQVYTVHCLYQSGQSMHIDINGSVFEMAILNPKDLDLNEQSAQLGNEQALHADMPGRVVKILVEVGDQLHKGDALIVLEAMKMENELRAQTDVTVARVCVQKGDSIDSGQLLIEFAAKDA